jgi:hypothetical protein
MAVIVSRYWRRIAATSLLACALALAGCGKKDPENVVHVRGTATYAGRPIPRGMIVFEPDPSKGSSGPQGHADIKDGHFDTSLSNKGAVVGP